ncbi:MAG: hypothetical protein ACRD72_01735 [Candidatus Angelobacter sp.]
MGSKTALIVGTWIVGTRDVDSRDIDMLDYRHLIFRLNHLNFQPPVSGTLLPAFACEQT